MRLRMLIVLSLIVVAPSVLCGQPLTQLTPEQKAELDRLRAMNIPLSSAILEKNEKHFLAIGAARQYRNNTSIAAIAGLFDGGNSGEFMKFLELTPEQEPKIREIHEVFLRDLKAIDSKTEVEPRFRGDLAHQRSSDRRERRKEFIAAIEEVLLTHQMEALSELDIRRVGPIKASVHPVIAERLELSDRQKEKIKKQSDKLALEIFEFVHKKRQEAFDVLQDELSEEQFEKLESIYNTEGKTLDAYLREVPMKSLYHRLQFTRREGEDTSRHAIEYIMGTELKRKKSKK